MFNHDSTIELFKNSSTSLASIRRQAMIDLEDYVNRIKIEKLKTLVGDDVVHDFVNVQNLVAPQLDVPNKKVSKEEISQGGSRYFTRFKFSIPFVGNQELFYCAAQTYTISAGTRAIVNQNTVDLIFDYESLENLNIEMAYGTELGRVQQNLKWLKPDVQEIKNALVARGNSLIHARLDRENATSEILETLNKL